MAFSGSNGSIPTDHTSEFTSQLPLGEAAPASLPELFSIYIKPYKSVEPPPVRRTKYQNPSMPWVLLYFAAGRDSKPTRDIFGATRRTKISALDTGHVMTEIPSHEGFEKVVEIFCKKISYNLNSVCKTRNSLPAHKLIPPLGGFSFVRRSKQTILLVCWI